MRKKKAISCKKFRNQHSKDRALERYGLELNRFDLKEIIDKIRAEKGYFIRRRSCRVSEWEVEVKGKLIRVLFDKIHNCIATVVPIDKKRY